MTFTKPPGKTYGSMMPDRNAFLQKHRGRVDMEVDMLCREFAGRMDAVTVSSIYGTVLRELAPKDILGGNPWALVKTRCEDKIEATLKHDALKKRSGRKPIHEGLQ